MDKNNKIYQNSGSQLLRQLRLATAALGKDILGFSPTDLGLHSAHNGAAMAMFLAGVPVYTIMLLGRWSSDAFLRYIRKQVKEFSKGISKKMLKSDKFFTIPTDVSNVNTKIKSNMSNTSSQNGPCFNNAVKPLLSVFH
jgi:hypothetical protein